MNTACNWCGHPLYEHEGRGLCRVVRGRCGAEQEAERED